MKPIIRSISVLALLMATGCATLKIESRVREGYTANIKSLFVVLATGPTGSKAYLANLGPKLETKITANGIKCKVHVYDDLNPDEKSVIKTKFESIKADLILQVLQTSRTTVNGANAGGVFEMSMSEPGSETYVWKANMITSGDAIILDTPEFADRTANDIINKLIEDKLLKPQASK